MNYTIAKELYGTRDTDSIYITVTLTDENGNKFDGKVFTIISSSTYHVNSDDFEPTLESKGINEYELRDYLENGGAEIEAELIDIHDLFIQASTTTGLDFGATQKEISVTVGDFKLVHSLEHNISGEIESQQRKFIESVLECLRGAEKVGA